MTTTPAAKPDEASAADPGAMDLADIKARYEDARKSTENDPWNFSCDEALRAIVMEDHPALIAAFEALRARVALLRNDQALGERIIIRLEGVLKETGLRNSDLAARAEAAEAREVELAGVLEDIEARALQAEVYHKRLGTEACFAGIAQKARTVLAGTPAQALERANLGKALITASDAVIDTGPRIRSDPVSHEFALAKLCNVMGRISALDALGKEEEP